MLTDLEITKLCAEAMGLKAEKWSDTTSRPAHYRVDTGTASYAYNPLHDDSQAMALVKKFRLDLNHDEAGACWASWFAEGYEGEGVGERHVAGWGANENVAICKCVAAMQVRARQES